MTETDRQSECPIWFIGVYGLNVFSNNRPIIIREEMALNYQLNSPPTYAYTRPVIAIYTTVNTTSRDLVVVDAKALSSSRATCAFYGFVLNHNDLCRQIVHPLLVTFDPRSAHIAPFLGPRVYLCRSISSYQSED